VRDASLRQILHPFAPERRTLAGVAECCWVHSTTVARNLRATLSWPLCRLIRDVAFVLSCPSLLLSSPEACFAHPQKKKKLSTLHVHFSASSPWKSHQFSCQLHLPSGMPGHALDQKRCEKKKFARPLILPAARSGSTPGPHMRYHGTCQPGTEARVQQWLASLREDDVSSWFLERRRSGRLGTGRPMCVWYDLLAFQFPRFFFFFAIFHGAHHGACHHSFSPCIL